MSEDPYPEMTKLARYSSDDIDLLTGLLSWLGEHGYDIIPQDAELPPLWGFGRLVHRYLGIDPDKLAAERALWRQQARWGS